MSSLLKGNVSDLRKLQKRLNKFPVSLVHNVAKKTSPALTSKAKADFSAGRTVYGDVRPRGVNGRPLDLVRTGATLSQLGFRTSGTRVRCVLLEPYAPYLIGKYRILPMGRMPLIWAKRIQAFVEEERF